MRGPGGHTARPQLTVDLVYALGLIITGLPGLLSRRVDPRAGLSLVWGSVQAGRAANAIPAEGSARATIRVADRDAWDGAEKLIRELVSRARRADRGRGRAALSARRAAGGQRRRRGGAAAGGGARRARAGRGRRRPRRAWAARTSPGTSTGCRARWPGSASRRPGQRPFDLHQADFDIDEAALDVGVRYTVELALAALAAGRLD